jgi:predicted secreted Zn-dependent protease
MTRSLRLLTAAAAIVWIPAAAHADWKPVEKIEHYQVSGRSGIDLYRSIGENGPQVGVGRAIAFTDFKLLWSRDYRPQPDGSCTLASARPSLTIIYRLPKASGDMPAATRRLWETFVTGVAAHEKVHGEFIVDLVKAIEATSIGLSAPNDPDCQKVRAELQSRLGPLSQEQRRRSREFDQVELTDGGNVHRLVLALVNGG